MHGCHITVVICKFGCWPVFLVHQRGTQEVPDQAGSSGVGEGARQGAADAERGAGQHGQLPSTAQQAGQGGEGTASGRGVGETDTGAAGPGRVSGPRQNIKRE